MISAFETAYKSWQRVSMFEVGPAEQTGLRLNVNTYPSDINLIETSIESGEFNLELPSNRDAKGFPAIDYVLNGIAPSQDDVLAIYTGANANKYFNYLKAIADDIENRVTAVTNEWNATYRNTFVINTGSSATASVDRFVNDFIFYYEKFLRAGKLGIPLGVFTGETAPNTLEALYSPELSRELFLEGLNATQDFFNGKHANSVASGESLSSYLKALNTLKNNDALEDLINTQFNLARNQFANLTNFKEEIENNNPPTNMLLAYDEVQRVVPLLKVDMVSAMSISIDFVDADGD